MIKAALVFFGFTAAQSSPDDIQAVYGIQVQPDPTVVTERAVVDPDAVDSACTTCIADNYDVSFPFCFDLKSFYRTASETQQ